MCGPNKQFMFIHLSLQEFLATFHISQMDQHQQVAAFKLVFCQNPLSPVLTFYAGLTGLKIDEVRDILLKVLNKPINIEDIVKKLGLYDFSTIHSVNPARDLRRHMLALMNCMYETQNVNLYADVKLPMSNELFTSNKRIQHASIQFLGMLLYPTDCLAIGYFLRHVNTCNKKNNSMVCFVDFYDSLLGKMEVKALAIELQKPARNHKICIILNFLGVYISSEATDALAALISNDSCVFGLHIDCDQVEDETLLFKYCTEGFFKCTLLPKQLMLLSTHCTYVIYYLILLLRCSCLKNLTLSSRNCLLFANPNTTLLFCEAIKYSHLKSLSLYECGIDDDSLRSLMAALCHKYCTIEYFSVQCNPYSEYGLISSLELLLNSPFMRLHELSVNHVSDGHKELLVYQ